MKVKPLIPQENRTDPAGSNARQAAKSERLEKEFSETIIESAPGIFYVIDKRPRYIRWNSYLNRLTGLSDAQLRRVSVLSAIHADDRPVIAAKMQEAFNTGYAQAEARVLTHERGVRDFFFTARRFKVGDSAYLVGFGVDVTEHNLAQEALRKSSDEIEDLYHHAGVGYHSLDKDGVIIRINDTELAWLGYSREEVVGKVKIAELLTPGSVQIFRENFPRFKECGQMQDLEFEMVRKDGTVMPALLSATAIKDGNGDFLMSRSTIYEMSERKRILQALRDSEERFRNAMENAPIGMAIVGLDGRFIQTNRAICKILGYTEAELETLSFQDVTQPEDLGADLVKTKQLVDGGITSYQMEKRYIRKDGQTIWAQISRSIVKDAKGTPLYFISQIEDITERKMLHRELERQACTDSLTGSANRRHFLALARNELARTQRYRHRLSLLMMDIDHFKAINDKHGHHVGDITLQAFVRECRHALRDEDILGRIGGEEFAALLPETDAVQARHVAERLRLAICAAEVNIIGQDLPLRFTVSIGIATLRDESDIDPLLKRADQALYEAKRTGRNKICAAG